MDAMRIDHRDARIGAETHGRPRPLHAELDSHMFSLGGGAVVFDRDEELSLRIAHGMARARKLRAAAYGHVLRRLVSWIF